MHLVGQVETGLGKAICQTKQCADEIRMAIGVPLVSGTLNVRIPKTFVPPQHAEAVRIERLGDRDMPFRLYPGRIGRIRIWVARSLSQVEESDDLLEIMSAVHLRTTLGLQDGDRVEIEMLD